ncbi:hypothetical protein Theos_1215 [Thermus oshimai JL-2]|uniref:Outer membrane protein beta-barrel domain-containing protein n=2 Tax=Thermus oshimai TaxID=56957 RepID=K7QV34_THEOS|nr:hypothetical protein Theos_1215 [Thermus oshimai JL-2]
MTVGLAQRFSVEAGAGYIYSGLGGGLAVVAEDLAPGLPLGVRLGVGFATSDGLDDGFDLGGGTTFGDLKQTAELSEWGQNIALSLDVLYKLPIQGLPVSVAPYAGVRYNLFSGGYTDPEDNLTTVKSGTVSSNALGFGAGVRVAYPLMANLDVVADLGVDYFLQACITQTVVDDSNNSSSNTVCPGDTGYDDLNKFVTQPDGFVAKFRLGAAYRF